MNPEDFKQALTDLYNHYNPSKVKDVDNLVKNYADREYDAIKTLILRYNFKGHPSYSENANRDEYVHYIIKNYSLGNNVLSKENLKKENEQELLKKLQKEEEERIIKEQEKASILSLGEEVKNEIELQIEELSSQLKDLIENKTSDLNNLYLDIKNFFKQKEQEFLERENSLNSITGQTVINEIIKEEKNYTKVNIENLNFTMSDIQLPPESVLETLSKGTKLIVKNSEGRVCGVEVTDITYDLISYENEIVKEIMLSKI